MDDPRIVRNSERLRHLFRYTRQRFGGAGLPDHLAKSPSGYQLHHNVVAGFGLADLMNRNDVRMV
jgi:hypothetical protein